MKGFGKVICGSIFSASLTLIAFTFHGTATAQNNWCANEILSSQLSRGMCDSASAASTQWACNVAIGIMATEIATGIKNQDHRKLDDSLLLAQKIGSHCSPPQVVTATYFEDLIKKAKR